MKSGARTAAGRSDSTEIRFPFERFHVVFPALLYGSDSSAGIFLRYCDKNGSQAQKRPQRMRRPPIRYQRRDGFSVESGPSAQKSPGALQNLAFCNVSSTEGIFRAVQRSHAPGRVFYPCLFCVALRYIACIVSASAAWVPLDSQITVGTQRL